MVGTAVLGRFLVWEVVKMREESVLNDGSRRNWGIWGRNLVWYDDKNGLKNGLFDVLVGGG